MNFCYIIQNREWAARSELFGRRGSTLSRRAFAIGFRGFQGLSGRLGRPGVLQKNTLNLLNSQFSTVRNRTGLFHSMMRGRSALTAFVLASAWVASGCSFKSSDSIISDSADNQTIGVAANDELIRASNALQSTPWPHPDPVTLTTLMTGAGPEHISASESAALYALNLIDHEDAWDRLGADVSAVIASANRLAAAAYSAALSPYVSQHELAIVEAAIQSVGEDKRIVLDAARELETSLTPLPAAQVKKIKSDFNRAIVSLQASADALAMQLENIRNANYDAPRETPPEFDVAGGG